MPKNLASWWDLPWDLPWIYFLLWPLWQWQHHQSTELERADPALQHEGQGGWDETDSVTSVWALWWLWCAINITDFGVGWWWFCLRSLFFKSLHVRQPLWHLVPLVVFIHLDFAKRMPNGYVDPTSPNWWWLPKKSWRFHTAFCLA